MLLPILTLALAAPAPEPPPDAPKGPAPVVMVLNVDKDGRPYLQTTVTTYKPVTETVTVLVNGQPQQQTRVVMVPVTENRRVFLDDPGVSVCGPDGKKIDPKNLPKLTGPAPALVSADGKDVDPFYLGLAKQGTLVIVAPSFAGPQPPGPPPPPKP